MPSRPLEVPPILEVPPPPYCATCQLGARLAARTQCVVLGVMAVTWPVDLAEAKRLLGLAAPEDLAEARRLFGLAAAQGRGRLARCAGGVHSPDLLASHSKERA